MSRRSVSLPHALRGPKPTSGSHPRWRTSTATVSWFAATIAECLPALRHRAPEATYLAWVDGRGLGLDVSPTEHFLEQGRVAFADGAAFGDVGNGFFRVNLATSRSILEQIVERMVSCLPPAARGVRAR